MMKPQQRTLNDLTKRGYLCASVEKREQFPDRKKHRCPACGNNPMISVSVDLWNVFDIVAVKPSIPGVVGLKDGPVFVQTTSRSHHSTRRNKILASMEAKLVLL